MKGQTMQHDIQTITLTDIDADALPRDRVAQDPQADAELQMSILRHGLRQPIELWPRPDSPGRYGLISGHRRLSALRALEFETVPAFVRNPESVADALAVMVTENESRTQISPWEKGKLLQTCLHDRLFDSPDAAIDALFPALSRQKRGRLRSIMLVVDSFDGLFTTPEALSTARIEQLASALRAGWEDLLLHALPPAQMNALASQWAALEPVLIEALSPEHGSAAPGTRRAPRRMVELRRGLTIRRELTRSGWVLRFTGPDARSPGLIDDVMDYVEQMFAPQ
jgi:ParB family chromosome partitioning protein